MKPHVICHMVTSVDGKILGDRWGKLPGGTTPSELYESTQDSFGIGAWLVGTTTMREFMGKDQKLPSGGKKLPKEDFVAHPEATKFAIGTDAKGKLRFQDGFIDEEHVVLLVTERVSNAYLVHLRQAGVSYLFCGNDQVDLKVALEKLRKKLGIKQLLLEGGGTFNGAMLQAGLVDELSQIIVPIADGGGPEVTGVYDGPGDPGKKAAAVLKLDSVEKLDGGALWLRYQVVRRHRS
jgi:riboflavin biosynthesis pyrimidine reductase